MGNSQNSADSVKITSNFITCKDVIAVEYTESLGLRLLRPVAHCMIYSKCNADFNGHKHRAAVLMQLRYDGHIGFPGGMVDHGENPVDALNRESVEEIKLDLFKFRVSEKNHIISHIDYKNYFVTHFFALEVSMTDFKVIEKRCLDALDYGIESLGILRPCLYTMHDCVRGFPSFLKNNFVGTCKEQLCHGLKTCNIMTEEEIRTALKISNESDK